MIETSRFRIENEIRKPNLKIDIKPLEAQVSVRNVIDQSVREEPSALDMAKDKIKKLRKRKRGGATNSSRR